MANTNTAIPVSTEGQRVSYAYTQPNLAPTASGIVLLLQGSASKVVRVTRIETSGTLTTAAVGDVLLVRYNTAATGGTVGLVNGLVPMDPNDPAATAVFASYTVPPTSGNSVGTIRQSKTIWNTPTAAPDRLIWEFGNRNTKSLLLRGATDWIGLFVAFGSYTGAATDISVEFTEE